MTRHHSESLPTTGYLRVSDILRFIPIAASTWWAWVKQGRAPAPIKLGPRTTAWRAEDIRALIESFSAQ